MLKDPALAATFAAILRQAVADQQPGGQSMNAPVCMIRYAKVSVASPLTILLGDDPDPQEANRLSSYTPTALDIVAVIQPSEGELLVLGKVI